MHPQRLLTFWFAILLLLWSASPPATAQTPAARTSFPEHRYGYGCAFDSVQQVAWQRNPGARRNYENFLQQVAAMTPSQRARLLAQPDVTVPVVIHIIHTGNGNNITDQQVYDAIRVINEDFSKTNPDTTDVIAAFQSRYTNVGFRFRLAQIDPNGNCTTGITRTYSTETSIGDAAIKAVINWDANRYLNIWVADAANGNGGYSTFPCAWDVLEDGIVVRNGQFGSIGRSCGTNFCTRTLTHEIGHYFGLPHTWGGTNTPGSPANCGIDDGIADTPNTTGVGAPAGGSGCPLNSAPCGVLANVQNYMDYASCGKMFTDGQRAVMRASLLMSCRSTLVSAANLVATGTQDGFVSPGCAPTVAFRPSTREICEGGVIAFREYAYNAVIDASTQFSWSFPGGQPATSTQRNPVVSYPTNGIYPVTLTVTTAAGVSGTLTQAQLIRVHGPGSGVFAPFAESFETPTFPINYTDPDLRNWTAYTSTGGSTARWERRADFIASQGTSYLRVRNRFVAAGYISTLISPNINLAGVVGPAILSFDRAYARPNTTTNDQLQLAYSTDCGLVWTPFATYNAQDLNTQGNQRPANYVPDSLSDWQTTSLPLPATVQGSARLMLRLQMVSDRGGNFYLDNLRIGIVTASRASTLAARGISVYPNPLTAETAMHFALDAAERVQLRLTDVLGREILTTAPKLYGAGEHALALAGGGKALPAGVYTAHLTLGSQTYTAKVLVQ